jgi:4-amino-4-deoxy-L-arabinose transferase-like glycosyltransferase
MREQIFLLSLLIDAVQKMRRLIMPKNEKYNYQTIGIALCFSVCAMMLMLFMTGPLGVAVGSDAVHYIQAARSFSEGQGFGNYFKDGHFGPMTYWPPLFSAALSCGRFLGVDILDWARYMNSFLFGVNVFIMALFAFYITGTRRALFMVGGMALVFAQFVEVHNEAMSEPLFFTLLLLALWSLTHYAEKGRMRSLVAAGILSGLCLITRYPGFALFPTAFMVICVFSAKPVWDRIKASAVFLAFALPLPLLWILRNQLMTGRPVGFRFGLSADAFQSLFEGVNIFSQYFFFASWPLELRAVLLVIVLVVLVSVIRQFLKDRGVLPVDLRVRSAWRVINIFALMYALTVVAALFMSNMEVPFEVRKFVPIPVVYLLLIPTVLCFDHREKIRKWGMVVVVVF